MATPAYIQRFTYFYATGNTPAACLTQNLPPDQDADLLLLGCGDVRNVLFTVYAGMGSKGRKLDMTCCDVEPEIIARNLLLYTLIIDDENGRNTENLWKLYNHIYIDDSSLALLRSHATHVTKIATSCAEWNNSKYGSPFRFCDNHTFEQVTRLWRFYALDPSCGQDFTSQQRAMKDGLRKAQDHQKIMHGQATNFTGIRSIAPVLSSAVLKDVPASYDSYWKSGKATSDSCLQNPLFSTHRSDLMLYYGSNPLLGYHLAPAYAPLGPNSPLQPGVKADIRLNRGQNAAYVQFCAYTAAFKKARARLVIRFVNCDALALCHMLRGAAGLASTEGVRNQSLLQYRDRRHFDRLTLDSGDYSHPNSNGSIAPLYFDVIDTSNLVDHLGCLNVLAATSPLLKATPMSLVRTEVLVRRKDNIFEAVNSLVCGPLVTVAALLQLRPVHYWTNATATSSDALSSVSQSVDDEKLSRQLRHIVLWKKLDGQSVREDAPNSRVGLVTWNADDLVKLMYSIYLKLFEDESWVKRLNSMSAKNFQDSHDQYTRTSLAAILRIVHDSIQANWQDFINWVDNKICYDNQLNMGLHYIQELYVQLHIRDLYGISKPDVDSSNFASSPFAKWKNIPATVSITLKVPRNSLLPFQPFQATNGSPVCHVMLECSDGRQNIFSEIQTGFGKVKTTGENFTTEFAVQIVDDHEDWDGNNPLIVSAVVPTWILLEDPGLATKVIFALKSTPNALMAFMSKYGMFLNIHEATANSKDVFITRDRPNLSSRAQGSLNRESIESARVAFSTTTLSEGRSGSSAAQSSPGLSFHLRLDETSLEVNEITTHIDMVEENARQVLRDAKSVDFKYTSPSLLTLDLGSPVFKVAVHLPMPAEPNGRTRIARKSSYVEFIAPIASRNRLSLHPGNIFPVHLRRGRCILDSLHYLELDVLPILSVNTNSKLTWLTTLLSLMFSARERALREEFFKSPTTCPSPRVNFKDSLMSMVSRFAGLQDSKRASIFGLGETSSKGIQIIIAMAGLRLDLSNQTVAIDAAVIPLTKTLVKTTLAPFLKQITERDKLISIRVDDAELELWQATLPSFAERCRGDIWAHSQEHCEYITEEVVPLREKHSGYMILCSCGKGRFPRGFSIVEAGVWNGVVSQNAVRAAIPVWCSVPWVDEEFNPSKILETTCRSCGRSKEDLKGHQLSKCGRCGVVRYCSKECQAKDWKEGGHKKICKAAYGKE